MRLDIGRAEGARTQSRDVCIRVTPVALTLGSNLHVETHLQLVNSALAAVVGILCVGVTIFLCYWLSEGLQRVLGPTGTSILIRLSAFLVVCIGIQIMFNGLQISTAS